MTRTEWVFRHAGGCLIESPDFAVVPRSAVASWRWVTTLWLDPSVDDGWASLPWRPGERGWVIPCTSAIGDIVEFGVGWTMDDGNSRHDRWWGWIDRASPRALIVVGPYAHPAAAGRDARFVVDEIRLDQLSSPEVAAAVSAAHTDRRPG